MSDTEGTGSFGDPVAPAPRVTRNVPPKRVRIHDGVNVTVNDEPYSGGDEVVVEGPVADEWSLQGQATIIESVPDALDYAPADDHEVEHEVTQKRTQLGQEHSASGKQASEEDFTQ